MEAVFKNYITSFAIPSNFNTKRGQLVTIALFLDLLSTTILWIVPMDIVNRTMMFDLNLWFQLAQNLNWVIVCFALDNFFFQLIMINPNRRVIEFLYRIIYRGDMSFFIRKHVQIGNQKKLAYDLVMKHLKKCFSVMRYFVVFRCK